MLQRYNPFENTRRPLNTFFFLAGKERERRDSENTQSRGPKKSEAGYKEPGKRAREGESQ